MNRDIKKNALAISSNQSEVVGSFDDVNNNYKTALKTANLKDCPDYWEVTNLLHTALNFGKAMKTGLIKEIIYKESN